jgi:hypothetical protein
MRVRLTQAIADEYLGRAVFGGDDDWPFVPEEPGVHDLPRETLVAMRDDAEHQGNVHGDGVEYLPAGTRRAYRALYKKLLGLLQ